MQVILREGTRHNLDPRIDTLVIDPKARCFTLTWRARIGLRRSIHEVETLIVGRPTRGWEHARRMEKPYWDLKELKQLRTRFEGADVRQTEETR
jgi:hypothetical protein